MFREPIFVQHIFLFNRTTFSGVQCSVLEKERAGLRYAKPNEGFIPGTHLAISTGAMKTEESHSDLRGLVLGQTTSRFKNSRYAEVDSLDMMDVMIWADKMDRKRLTIWRVKLLMWRIVVS